MAELKITKQHCEVCGRTIEIDALEFLMNLGRKIICEECKKSGKKYKKGGCYVSTDKKTE